MKRPKLFVNLPARLIGEVAVFQALSYFFPLLTLPLLSRMLGIAEFGTLFWHLSAVGLIGVVSSYGFEWSGTRALAKERDAEDQLRILGPILWAKFLLAGCGSVLLLAAGSCGLVRQLDLGLTAFLCLDLLFASWIPSIFFIARQESSKTLRFHVVSRMVLLLGVAACYLANYPIRPIDYAALMVLSQALLLVLSYRLIPSVSAWSNFNRQSTFNALREGFAMFSTLALTHVYTSSNVLFVAYFSSAAEAGRFAASAKLMGTATQLLVGSVSLVLFPSAVHAAKSVGLNPVVRGNLWLVFAGGTLLALVFALLGPQMVTWFFGPEYHLRPLASALIGLLAILVGISNAFGTQGLVANGREFHVALVIAIGALVAVFGHSYWVPRYGAEGGIYAWIMAEFVVTVLSVFAYYQFQRS